jgi:hypothetical protein
MSRAKLVLILIALLGLAGVSLYMNRDWFAEQPIQISYRVSPWLKDLRRGRPRGAGEVGPPVVFSLDPHLRLVELKVVIAAELATNKYAHPLWHLISDSNSVPTGSFAYGDRIRGMYPKVKGAAAEPLLPGVRYRLLLTTAEKRRAQHDFSTTPHDLEPAPSAAAAP